MTVSDALKAVLQKVNPLKTEQKVLEDVLGRVLAEPVISKRDHPPWDNSAMDGFAVCAADTQKPPKNLKIIEEIRCGSVPLKRVSKGECSRIMTGAPLPGGADSVVRMEETEELTLTQVTVLESVSKGEYIRTRGEDIAAGQLVLPRGTVMGPAEMAMGATAGGLMLNVYQRPRVAILATGDELIHPGESPGPGQIPNSNTYALMAQVTEAGGLPINLGIALDDPKELREKIKAGGTADVLLISGGVSVGKYDYVKEVLSELGIELSFWKISMKPGHPLVFAVHEGRLIFGLPGNPVSTLVTFEEFVRPALKKMGGHEAIFRPTVKAISKENIRKDRDGKTHFIRVVIHQENGDLMVQSTGGQGSGILSSMVKANGLLVIPEGISEVRAGESVTVQLLDKGLSSQATPGF